MTPFGFIVPSFFDLGDLGVMVLQDGYGNLITLKIEYYGES